jgi:hypothetical protein
MIVVYIILGIVAYLIIGGIAAAIVDDEDLEVGCIVAWPLMLLTVAVYGVVQGAKFIGYGTVALVKKYIKNDYKRWRSEHE